MVRLAFEFVIAANICLIFGQFVHLEYAWYPNHADSRYITSTSETAPFTKSRRWDVTVFNVIVALLFNVGCILGVTHSDVYPVHTAIIWSTVSVAVVASGLLWIDRQVTSDEIANSIAMEPVGVHQSEFDLEDADVSWLRKQSRVGWGVVLFGFVSLGALMSSISDNTILVLAGYLLLPLAIKLVMIHRMGLSENQWHQYTGIGVWVMGMSLVMVGLYE
jgi:hypothetical protein